MQEIISYNSAQPVISVWYERHKNCTTKFHKHFDDINKIIHTANYPQSH